MSSAEPPSWLFDDRNGTFEARLRRTTMTTRTSRSDGREITVSNTIAIIETKFNYDTLDRLYYPSFVGIERQVGGSTCYVIFEVVSVNPTHYQMLGMDVSMPTLLRKEYLDTINESWGKSQETWIDLAAIPTWYITRFGDGDVQFVHTRLVPLSGARVHLLSKRAVQKFLCYDDGESAGNMIGFDLPLRIRMENLIRFHAGLFGFTGSGKSNLTSSLIRSAMNADRDLTVVVFDVAGEYALHLLDLLGRGRVITNENIHDSEQFRNSQTVPESLEDQVGSSKIRAALGKVQEAGLVERLSLQESGGLDLAWIQQLLERTVSDARAGGTTAKIGLEKLSASFYNKRGLQPNTRIVDLEDDVREEFLSLLRDVHDRSHEKSGLRSEVEQVLAQLETPTPTEEEVGPTPEKLAYQLATGKSPGLTILYLPEPVAARITAARLIDRLLYLRKKIGSKGRILMVLDEAQEYIPDNPTEKTFTLSSNYAVENLLRQGRKYRVHCWLATQRVAHLNVSALQQLHSYFVSTLPRMYDRMVIADSFALPYEVLERSAQLETGQWIFVSYKATKQRNVPVFLETENNEVVVAEYLKSRRTD